MALTQVWAVPGVSPTTIDATDSIAFSGTAVFGTSITVDAYNGGTHVRSSVGADDSSGNTPNNVKFISQDGGTASDSQADWGDGTEDIDAILAAECNLTVTIGYGTNITVTDASIFAYDGTTEGTAPTETDVYCFERLDIVWTNIDGSAAAMALEDSTTPATSHVFYMGLSVKPTVIGTKADNAVKFAFTYQ